MERYQDHIDAEAFDEIVLRFVSPAVAVAHQILADRVLAEDAVQEAFLRIVRRREQYRRGRPFASWFYAILRNVCTDMLRERTRRRRLLSEASARGPAQEAEPWAAASDVADLLAGLPKNDRAVLTLRIVHDLPFRDVAAALGVSEEAAKKRAQRALRRLRSQALPESAATGQLDPSASRSRG